MEPSSAASRRHRLALIGDGTARAATGPLEHMRPEDVLHDYTLVPYDPATPTEGKLRSVNVLLESFALAGVEPEGRRVVDLIRDGLGSGRTVWGAKWDLRTMAHRWELYFYDPPRETDLDVGRVARMLEPAVRVDAAVPVELPWHMFSVELDMESLRGAVAVPLDVYVSTNPRVKGTDRSYKVSGGTLRLENLYTFHQPDTEMEEVLYRLQHGVHYVPGRHSLASLIPPRLLRCKHICVANKRETDALYFSGLSYEQLVFALGFFGVRSALVDYVTARAEAFAHLLWDVGVDYVGGGRDIAFTKVGIYGSF